jgi:hypothetical protein
MLYRFLNDDVLDGETAWEAMLLSRTFTRKIQERVKYKKQEDIYSTEEQTDGQNDQNRKKMRSRVLCTGVLGT